MTDKESVNRFRRLVQAQIGCAEKLIKALEQERLALLARDAQELTRVGTSKTTLLREMEQRLQAHETFLKALRLPPGKEGSEALLKTLPKDGDEWNLWRKLQELATQCRDHNEVNGSLLAASRARMERAFQILRGVPENTRTYGRGGDSQYYSDSQVLGKA